MGLDVSGLPDEARGALSEGTIEQQIADLEEVTEAHRAWTPAQRAEEIAEWAALGVDARELWAEQEERLRALRAGEDVD